MSEQHTNKTVLGADCRITGELSLDNDAVIMGQFRGTLRVSGVLEITDSAHVSGTIVAGALRLSGRVDANVVAEHGTELLAVVQLVGQLYTTTLSVVEGAVLESDVCVGPKAMQAAGALLRQVEAASSNDGDEAESSQSVAPAEQADEQEQWNERIQHQALATTAAAAAQINATDDDDEEPAPIMAPVRTVPSTLNSMLTRRRTKILGSNGLKPAEGENAGPHLLNKPNPAAKAS